MNVFVVNNDYASRNEDINICLMVRDVNVYGCECGEDAVSLAGSVVPELVFFRLIHSDDSYCQSVKSLTVINPKSIIVVASCKGNIVCDKENEYRAAGVSSFISEFINNDNLLYVVKNFADIIKARSEKRFLSADKRLPKNMKFFSYIAEAKGYNDILSMNRRFASLNIKPNLSRNLTYIRVFSFLYDFLVKCFLGDIVMIVGFAADTRRILIEFPLDNDILKILENSVFYSIVEKYMKLDNNFCRICLELDSSEFGSVVDMSSFIGRKNLPERFNSGLLFEKTLDNVFHGAVNLLAMLRAAKFYEGFVDIFSFFADYLESYQPSIEVEFHRDELLFALKAVDNALGDMFRFSVNAGNVKLFDIENELYFSVLRLQILLQNYRQI